MIGGFKDPWACATPTPVWPPSTAPSAADAGAGSDDVARGSYQECLNSYLEQTKVLHSSSASGPDSHVASATPNISLQAAPAASAAKRENVEVPVPPTPWQYVVPLNQPTPKPVPQSTAALPVKVESSAPPSHDGLPGWVTRVGVKMVNSSITPVVMKYPGSEQIVIRDVLTEVGIPDLVVYALQFSLHEIVCSASQGPDSKIVQKV